MDSGSCGYKPIVPLDEVGSTVVLMRTALVLAHEPLQP